MKPADTDSEITPYTPREGDILRKNGKEIRVNAVKGGWVYYAIGKERTAYYTGRYRMPIGAFVIQSECAELVRVGGQP